MSNAKQGGLSRRATIALMGGAVSAPWLINPSFAKPAQLVMATGGGKLEDAYKKVIYAPFQQKHGIAIATTSNPAAKLKIMVEQKQVEWDVMQGPAEEFVVLAKQGLFEPIDYSAIKKESLVPGTFHEHFVLTDLAAYHVAWNTKNVKSNPPQSWSDLWGYNGRIGLWKKPFQTLEAALLADGVEKSQLYPLDVERGLKSLAKIKDKLVWWATGAQGAQLVLDGEIDVCAIWNGRVHDPKMAGAPVDYHFKDAILVSDAWAVPKGTKNVKEAMELVALAMSADTQAAFAKAIPYGPTNTEALKLLDEKTRAVLPSPDTGIMLSLSYWAEHGPKVTERFNQWLLGA